MSHCGQVRSRSALVVVNFASHHLLEDCLSDVPEGSRVVIVDSYSSWRERILVTGLADRRGWELVTLDVNCGFGGSANAGVRHAAALGASEVLLLNPDALVEANAIVALLDHVNRQPGCLVAPRIIRPDGTVYFDGSYLNLETGQIRAHPSELGPSWVPWLTGACLAVSVDTFESLGGFDTRYFMYWEDVDLSYRALQKGYGIEVRRDLVVIHDQGGTQQSSSRGGRSDLFYRFNCRNRLLFAGKYLSSSRVLRWLVHTPREATLVYLIGGRRQLLLRPWSALAAFRGTVAGAAVAVHSLVVRAG